MTTLQAIEAAFAKIKSGADFPQFVRDLRDLDIIYFDNHVRDGAVRYVGADGTPYDAAALYPSLSIAHQASAESMTAAIDAQQSGKSTYPEFCNAAAASGAATWRVDIQEFCVIYMDVDGKEFLRVPFPRP